MRAEATGLDRSANKRVAWLLSCVILLSFVFGVAMFLPAEHRAQKLEQIKHEYQLKVQRARSASAEPPGHS